MLDAGLGMESLRPEQTIGYCAYCNKLVRRMPDAGCPNDHPAIGVSGVALIGQDEDIPVLPRFNWAAFAMPPLWGAGHGSFVAGLIVLPMWLFMDQAIQSAVFRLSSTTPAIIRVGVYGLAVAIVGLTLALMFWFGSRGWGLAWRKEYEDGTSQKTFAEFIIQQKRWAWVCVPLALFLFGYALYYWLTILPAQYVAL